MKLSAAIEIQCSPEHIFDITQDYSQRLKWDTFLKQAELVDCTSAAIGEKAWCVSKHGFGMETVYISFNRPKAVAIKQSKRSLIFKSFAGSWRFKQAQDDLTLVTFTYAYTLNFPFSLATPLIQRILVSNVQQRLTDLKAYAQASHS